jgi:nucleotide-binding universal stress UspA family protein
MEAPAGIGSEGTVKLKNDHTKTILIFTDFSNASLNAANYAAALTGQLHSSRLLICYSEHVPTTMEMHLQNIRLAEQEHQRNLTKLRTLKNEIQIRVSQQIVIDTYIDQRPLDEIASDFNRNQSAGLIVMGIAGKSRLEQTFVGSNTIRVARTSTIPLLIIPEHITFRKIEKVVFACDLKKVSKTTPALAIQRIIHRLGAKLSILNVDHNEEHFHPYTIAEINHLHQLWDADQSEYYYTNNKDVAKGVMDFSNEHQMQMVIAVTKEYGFFERLFHSNLTRKLAYNIHLPLLLFKEGKTQ